MIQLKTILTFLLICIISVVCAQIPAQYPFSTVIKYRIELNDGTLLTGKFLEKDEQSLYFKPELLPRIIIPFTVVKTITPVSDLNIKEKEHAFPNPHGTRYLFSPSAFNLKKGDGYYQNTYLLLNSFNVGITDYFSLGGGFEVLTTFSNGDNTFNPIAMFTPKVGFSITESIHWGGGVLIATLPVNEGNKTLTTAGFLYTVGTIGSLDRNATMGIGWGFLDKYYSQKPIITLSGMTRIAKKIALVSENWFVPTNDMYYGVVSYGVRFFGKRIAVDLAFLNNPDIYESIRIGIPYVDFAVKF